MKSVTGGFEIFFKNYNSAIWPLFAAYISCITNLLPFILNKGRPSGFRHIDFRTFPTITRAWMVLVVSSCSDPNSLHFISSLCSVLKGGINYLVPGMGQGKRVGLSLVSFRYSNILYLRKFIKIICN